MMKRVLADKKKNRLYLRLTQMNTPEMADEIIEIANAVKGLKPGFTCLTKLGDVANPSDKEKRMAQLVMEYLSMMGVSKVVRVGPETAFNLLDQASQEAGKYSAEHAATIEDAEIMLDRFSGRNRSDES